MRTKQVRPDKLEFEYELYISREFDKTKDKEFIQFDFRTIKVFENFEYKINLDSNIDSENKVLKFNIEGLSAPILDISKAGPACHKFKFFEFKNVDYDLILSKYGKNKCKFEIKISPKNIKIKSEPEKKFLEIFTEKYNVS